MSVTPSVTPSADQYLRYLRLVVADNNGKGLDLSQFRVKFSVKRNGVMTPNTAEIRVYNLKRESALQIQKEFTSVRLNAGYESNWGTIFEGDIKQCIIGRESNVDTFIDIIAGDGDRAYNFSVMTKPVAAGSSYLDQLNAAAATMAPYGVTVGYVGALPATKLPRGKSFYGATKDYVNGLADSINFEWSIQDGKIIFVPKSTYLPGEAVVLSSKSGMIGTPQQTVLGVNFRCLLNPKLRVHGRVQVDNKSVQAFKLDQFNPGSAANTPVPLDLDGNYYIWVVNYTGDTRGNEWYSDLTTMVVNSSANIADSVGII